MPLVILALATLVGCDRGPDLATRLQAADNLARAGDIAGADAAWREVLQADSGSLDAVIGTAWAAYARGDLRGADALLAAAQGAAGPRAGEIALRRALLALRRGDRATAVEHGRASGHPAGLLFAAEALLADGEVDEAMGLLEGVRDGSGPLAQVAARYLELLDHPDPAVAALGELAALWATGGRAEAVEAVVGALPEAAMDWEERDEQLLLWAGRAAALGRGEAARTLLAAMSAPPAGQDWRVEATAALADCADGAVAGCAERLDALDGVAPADGLAHARATAALLLRDRPRRAARLLARVRDDASARAAATLGDRTLAARLARDPLLSSWLQGR